MSLIAGSIREFGWTNPILVDRDNGIIAGHGRLMAAQNLGLKTVPVIELAHLTEAQKRAYVLADNKLAEQAGWDKELLALELGDLSELGVDLTTLGFEAGELDDLFRSEQPDPREEETPEPPVDPVSRPGDLCVLGKHRVICGDATDRQTVERLLDGVRPSLMVTDPPYGVEYNPAWRNKAKTSRTKRTGKVKNDDRADWREAWALFPGDVAYVWHAGLFAGTVADSLTACGFELRSQIIWVEGSTRPLARPLPLAARAVLVRGSRQGALVGRSNPDDALADRQPRAGRQDRSRHPKAGGVHAPAHAEQFLARAGGLRSLPRLGHHTHRCRNFGTGLPRPGTRPGLRRRDRHALGRLHGTGADPRRVR